MNLRKSTPGWRNTTHQPGTRKEVAMNNERKDDGLDVAWREFDAAVERLRRAVCDLESVLGRKDKEE